MPEIKDQMEAIYGEMPPKKIPWNMETPPDILTDKVDKKIIEPCTVLELGCGAGNYCIYLAEKGFTVTGIDISEKAIELAKENALKKKVECAFIAADVLGDLNGIGEPFDFAYDWELLHHIFPEDRKKYVKHVHRLLKAGGRYLSVCFSEKDSSFGSTEKYRNTPLGTRLYFSSEEELARLFEPLFDIQEIKIINIHGKYGDHRAVYAFMAKENKRVK
jgi:cyclopropane fatty-acyl-phospholipid synthase-like methyltransferase